MTITYELGNSLYINLTNRCTNNCVFCVRNNHDGVNGKDNLWLDREPGIEEIKSDFKTRNLTSYDSIVFCGYGEPLIRFDDVIQISKWIKEQLPDIKIRINTNGQANLICGRDVTPELKGLIDTISISLNADNANKYQELCKSCYGTDAYNAVLEFAALAKKYVPHVILSVVDKDMTPKEIDACRSIADKCGVKLRIREYIK